MAPGDLDGNGDLDVVLGRLPGPDQIRNNQGGAQHGAEGTYEASSLAGGTSRSIDVRLGDPDSDLDAVLTYRTEASDTDGEGTGLLGGHRIVINQGGVQGGVLGSFLVVATLHVDSTLAGSVVALGDLDGDRLGHRLTEGGLPKLGEGLPQTAEIDLF